MLSRTRLLITAAVLCHVLLASRLVTSQLPPADAAQTRVTPAASKASQPVTLRALLQEKNGPVYKLRGNVEIDYGAYIIRADEVTYDSDSSEVQADGHFVLEGGPNDEHIEATRGTYNTEHETGRFEHVNGTVGLRVRNRRMIFTTSNPFFFTGGIVEKTAPDNYVVYNGTVTTCELPRPKWLFSAHKISVDVGGNATIYRANFRIENIPVLYLPFATHPVQKESHQTGFLIPNIGRSSTRGYTAGESFFWAINPSMDLMAGTEYFSRRGWAPDAEFRARPTENSFADLTYFSVFDRGVEGVNQGGTEVRLNSEGAFQHNFRAVANIDYLSSYVFRLAFSDVFAQAVNSEVHSEAFLSNTAGSFFLNLSTRRYQNFESTTPGDVVTILHAPGIEVSSIDRQLGKSPFHGTLEASATGLSRSEPSFSTAPLLGRFDLSPAVSLPLHAAGWSVRPELSLRETIYTQQLIPSGGVGITDVGTAISNAINRKALAGSVEIRPPAVAKVFDREALGRKWKHVIEPRLTYKYVTGVENFSHILRFDERDVLSDTNEVEYAIVNRLYARRSLPAQDNCGAEGMPTLLIGGAAPASRIPWERDRRPIPRPCAKQPQTREIVIWELAQKYFLDPTFGGALVLGRRNVLATTEDLTGIGFLIAPRHLSPLISRLRVSAGSRSDLEWDVDYDFQGGRVNTSTALLNHHFGELTVGAGNAFLDVRDAISATSKVPVAQKFNQFRAVLGYGSSGKLGFSAATNLGFDAHLNQLQYGSAQIAYNWDCCGVNVEYRRFALGSVRNENQFRFTFALANVGAFGNLRRTERLF
jgi:LPS-assembly protein